MSFFSELKRRKMAQVAITYAVTGWLLLQVIAVVLPTFNAPLWVSQTLMLLVFLGFPVTLVFSWMFNITGEGIVRDKGEELTPSSNIERTIRIEQVMIGMLVVAVSFMAIDNYLLGDNGTSVPPVDFEEENSIAVLPFENNSNDPDQEYFSDGLSDELINKLSQVEGLLVTSRNSSFYFKGRDEDLPEIGAVLGVNNILQGSVRKDGNTVRITAQLIDARRNVNLWSDSWDRQMSDIFAIQDEIATEVTQALSITMGAGEFSLPGSTRNIEAWDYYLQAQEKFSEFSPSGMLESQRFSERAVQLDPDFGQNWLLLSKVLRNSMDYLPEQRDVFAERHEEVLAEIQRLQLQDDPLTRFEDAMVTYSSGAYQEAEKKFLANLEDFGRSRPEPNANYAVFLLKVGRVQEALPYTLRAERLDPLGNYHSTVGNVLARLDRPDESIDAFTQAVASGTFLAPDNADRAMVQLQIGDYEGARFSTGFLNLARDLQLDLLDYLQAGDTTGGLDRLKQLVPEDNSPLTRHAVMFAALFGDPQLGLDILSDQEPGFFDTGVNGRDLWYAAYSEIRRLPGFRPLMEKHGFADYWRSTGNWPDFCRPLDGGDDFECF